MPEVDLERWNLSLHEIAHLVVAESEGVHVQGACLLRDGGGACWHNECSGFSAALVASAGLAADKLSPDIPMPESAPPPSPAPLATAVDVVGTSGTSEKPAWMSETQAPTPSDAGAVALWCVGGCLLEPERWPERHAWLMSLAERILSDRRARWIRLAARLNRDGFLLPADARIVRDEHGI